MKDEPLNALSSEIAGCYTSRLNCRFPTKHNFFGALVEGFSGVDSTNNPGFASFVRKKSGNLTTNNALQPPPTTAYPPADPASHA